MKSLALLPLLLGATALSAAALTARQMETAESIEVLTVPAPSEFFAALDRALRPDWASFYREPGPANYPTRPRKAFNLGVLVTDGFLAVEAQDGQQVKNTGRDIINLARALGVGEDVLARGKSIADFADKNDWFALREELEATTNEVRRAMGAQRDEALASLITAGAWLRALEAGSRAVARAGEEEDAADLLSQSALLAYLHSQLEALPENTRTGPVVTRVGTAFDDLREAMATQPPPAEEIHETAAAAVAALADKDS